MYDNLFMVSYRVVIYQIKELINLTFFLYRLGWSASLLPQYRVGLGQQNSSPI